MPAVSRAQRVARALDDILHRIADIRVHVRRDRHVDDLRHQVTLASVGLGTDERVAAVSHDWLFLGDRTVGVQVGSEQIRVAAAVESRFVLFNFLGGAAGDEREQRESGQLPDHVP
ncbi:hypothetical protein D3C85_1582620 [compost metagenome]